MEIRRRRAFRKKPPNRIEKLRTRLGLTRPQMAYVLGVTEITVWRWETDAQNRAKPEGASAALLSALENQARQADQKKIQKAVASIAIGAAAGVALAALLGALFGAKK